MFPVEHTSNPPRTSPIAWGNSSWRTGCRRSLSSRWTHRRPWAQRLPRPRAMRCRSPKRRPPQPSRRAPSRRRRPALPPRGSSCCPSYTPAQQSLQLKSKWTTTRIDNSCSLVALPRLPLLPRGTSCSTAKPVHRPRSSGPWQGSNTQCSCTFRWWLRSRRTLRGRCPC